mgnify:CR=1 FL=1
MATHYARMQSGETATWTHASARYIIVNACETQAQDLATRLMTIYHTFLLFANYTYEIPIGNYR